MMGRSNMGKQMSAPGMAKAKEMAAPKSAVMKMAKGGMTRADGVCKKGGTKGKKY